MTQITIYRNENRQVQRFTCVGHAEYDDPGYDIVCASISILVINTINAIETFTADDCICEVVEENGNIDFWFPGEISHDSWLLVETMILGLTEIQNDYGNEFLILDFKEV